MTPLKTPWLGLMLPPAILILLLWLPFGFSLQGLIEEWDVLRMFTQSGVMLFVKPDSGLEGQWLRPLTVLPHAIAYLLDQDSFNAWHWLLIAALVVKGASASYLGLTIARSLRWGTFFGLLVLLYPADTMQLSFRSLHINVSLALLLLASAMLVRAQDLTSRTARWLIAIASSLILLIAQLMYEVAFALMALPLIVLWCRSGTHETLREVRTRPAPTVGWGLAAIAYAIYAIAGVTLRSDSYQQNLTEGRSFRSILEQAVPRLFDVGIPRALIGGWFDAWRIAVTEFDGFIYLFIFGLVCSLCVFLSPTFSRRSDSHSWRLLQGKTILRIAIAGVVLLMLGYAPYLFSRYHIVISQRTFLFAAPGAALVILAVILAIRRLSTVLAYVVVFLLLTIGGAAQLYQFQHYVNISLGQQKLLRSIVENVNYTPGKSLLVLDYSNQLSHTWFLRDHLRRALTYLYGKPFLQVQICLMPGGDWQERDTFARTGHCVEEIDNWRLVGPMPLSGSSGGSPVERVLSKADTLTVSISPDGAVTGTADPTLRQRQLALADTEEARRYRGVLKPWPWPLDMGMFQPTIHRDRYRWDFGTWWSLEVPTRGSGWREAEWPFGYLHRDAVAWKTKEESRLMFDMSPRDSIYRLRGHFSVILSESIKRSIQIKLNGHDLPLAWHDGGRFEAEIPRGLLRPLSNTIEFNSSVDHSYYDLSAQLTDFELTPGD